MFLNENDIFISIGLPMVIMYFLVFISFFEKRKKIHDEGVGNQKKIYFPVRDACIVSIALDIYQIMSIIKLDRMGVFFGAAPQVWMISSGVLISHIVIFTSLYPFYHGRNSINRKKLKYSKIIDLYIGMLFLMTNGVSLSALIGMAGGGIQ